MADHSVFGVSYSFTNIIPGRYFHGDFGALSLSGSAGACGLFHPRHHRRRGGGRGHHYPHRWRLAHVRAQSLLRPYGMRFLVGLSADRSIRCVFL